ncbi:MAG: hypothetical protein AAFR69_08165, partial [Pseudomonadota bacterium]
MVRRNITDPVSKAIAKRYAEKGIAIQLATVNVVREPKIEREVSDCFKNEKSRRPSIKKIQKKVQD